MEESGNFIERNRVMLKYLFLFFVFVVILYVIFYDSLVYKDFSKEFTASIVASLLNLFGISTSVDGATITVPNFTLNVIPECVGVFMMIIYSSFILSYPTNLKNKLIGIGIGIPCLFAIAVVRISSLAVIGMSHPDLWEYFHVYFWQMTLIIFVILLLLLWVEKVVKHELNMSDE